MIRIARYFGVAMLSASSIGAEVEPAQSTQSYKIAEGLRTAFYEHAPRSLATAMSKAVVSWCASDRNEPRADAVSWVCQAQRLVYFRSVLLDGAKGRHGLVCEDDETSKYLGMDLVAEQVSAGVCVPAEFDGSLYKLLIE
jgi:hypothetical protein